VLLALIVVGTVLAASCTSQETTVRTQSPRQVDGSDSRGAPRLVGLGLVRAIHMLRAEGLRVGSVTARRARAPKYEVVRQQPEPGTAVRRGKRIHMTISAGPDRRPYVRIPGCWLEGDLPGCEGPAILVSTASAQGSAFYACPDLRNTLPPGPGAGDEAAAAALRFAIKGGPNLADPASRFNWSGEGGDGDGSVLASRSAKYDGMVTHACGRAVAGRSWRVTIDDGSESASLDTWLYLVRRRLHGWKVWGAY